MMDQTKLIEFWSTVQSQLQPGDEIRNWTALKGYLGDSFKIVSVRTDHIIVKSPAAKLPQRAYKDDFALILSKWNEYLAGSILRKEFMSKTRVSKYTMSIINHLAQN